MIQNETPNTCPNCGPGECYNICPNSPNCYTPEQERYDEQFYGADYEREAYADECAHEAEYDSYLAHQEEQ